VELENQYIRGSHQYPNNITTAYNMLMNYKAQHPVKNNRRKEIRDAVYDGDEETGY